MMSAVRPRLKAEIACNGRLKTYPDGTQELLVCDKPIFGLDGWEERDPEERERGNARGSSEGAKERAKRRARQQIRDYALCSEFTYFVTLTLDKNKINRYDMSEIVKRLRVWLDNRVRRNGLRYVLVPERHKGGAVHFHGFFNDALRTVDSGHMDKNGHKVYNLPSWSFGFTTAIELYGDYHAAVSYVCKYVGKQSEKIGGRWYYSGGSLKVPQVDYVDVDPDIFEDEGGAHFAVEEAKLSFVSFRLSPEKTRNYQQSETVDNSVESPKKRLC